MSITYNQKLEKMFWFYVKCKYKRIILFYILNIGANHFIFLYLSCGEAFNKELTLEDDYLRNCQKCGKNVDILKSIEVNNQQL